MVRFNNEFRKGTEFNGSGKDTNDKTSSNREKTKHQRTNGGSTEQTLSGIAKDMEKITSEIKENYNKMITILDNNSLIINQSKKIWKILKKIICKL